MESKLIIFLLFAMVAQSCFALGSKPSCVAPTEIGADLAVIQYGRDSSLSGLARTLEIIFTRMKTVLLQAVYKIRVRAKDAALRTELAKNETLTVLMIGIIPTLEAIRTVQPDLAMEFSLQRTLDIMTLLDNGFYGAIEWAQYKNSSKSSTYIKAIENNVYAAGQALAGNLFMSIRNGTISIPVETDAFIACIQTRVGGLIMDALAAIFEGIWVLWEALSKKNWDQYKDYLTALDTAQKKSFAAFSAEVDCKYDVIRNLVIARFLNKTEVVAALFAIQSTDRTTYV